MSKKLSFKRQLIITCLTAGVFIAGIFSLFIAGVINVWASLIALSGSVVVFGAAIWFIVHLHKKKLKQLALQKKKEQDEINFKLLRFYEALGIEVQYNSDGSIKDLFQLLKINKVYDENGKRIMTPYELLKMNPVFDKNGNEKPLVFTIKNRVVKVAKSVIDAPKFTYKPKTKTVDQSKSDNKDESGKTKVDGLKTDKKDEQAKTGAPAKKAEPKAKAPGKPKVADKAKQAKTTQTHIISKPGKFVKPKAVAFDIPKPVKITVGGKVKDLNLIDAVENAVTGALKLVGESIKDITKTSKKPKPAPMVAKPRPKPVEHKPHISGPVVKPSRGNSEVVSKFTAVTQKNSVEEFDLTFESEEEMEK